MICCKLSPGNNSTDELLLIQHCTDQELCLIADISMTQYNMNQGLKSFVQSGVITTEKEVNQLVTMDALDPDNPKELSREDHRAAMAYLLFLKEKWYITVKAQCCCDGIVQRNYMKKEETIPPPPSFRRD